MVVSAQGQDLITRLVLNQAPRDQEHPMLPAPALHLMQNQSLPDLAAFFPHAVGTVDGTQRSSHLQS
jgi:hypothetical protein